MSKIKLNEQFEVIVQLQTELNEQFVTDWVNQNLDWKAAIQDECSEVMGSSVHWKWWKSSPFENGKLVDVDNVKVEAIDLLHFLISAITEKSYQGVFTLNDAVSDTSARLAAMSSDVTAKNISFRGTEKEFCAAIVFLTRNILKCSLLENYHLAAYSLFELFSILGMDSNEIFKQFISKNILNVYRSERGYNNPDVVYPKIHDGLEDNEHLSVIMSDYNGDYDAIEAVKEYVFAAMDARLGLKNPV
mgnify:CR=1 FL=1